MNDDSFDISRFSACYQPPAASDEARSFHQRDEAQCDVLTMLRGGAQLKKCVYEGDQSDGSRLAPVIEQLRNAHGFTIKGDGSAGSPYFMPDTRQQPSLARVTPEMRTAYYATPHWLAVRAARFERDSMACVLCSQPDKLQCHHVTYENLFRETLADVMTVCGECHGRIHRHCRLKFPSGVSVQWAAQIGWKGFEPWLLAFVNA